MLTSLIQRLQLSRAKHPSLHGHARLSKRFARLVPYYEYGPERFFASDGASAVEQALKVAWGSVTPRSVPATFAV